MGGIKIRPPNDMLTRHAHARGDRRPLPPPPPPPHPEQVVLFQPEVPRSQLDAFARLRLDGVDALVVVAVVTRVVGREQHPLHASHGRAAFG